MLFWEFHTDKCFKNNFISFTDKDTDDNFGILGILPHVSCTGYLCLSKLDTML